MPLAQAPVIEPARYTRAAAAATPRLAMLGVAALLLCAVVARLPRLHAIYQWDEADYIQAVRLGVPANWLAQTALPIEAFLRKGLIKWLQLGDQHIVVPAAYEPSRDVLALAHYHPPLVLFAAAAAFAVCGQHEWAARLPSLVPNLLAILLLVYGVPWVFGRARRGCGWFAGAALASMPVQIQSSRVLSMHPASACLTTAALLALMRFLATDRSAWLYTAAAAAALSLLALDFFPSAIVLILVACSSRGLVNTHAQTIRVSWRLLAAAGVFLGVLAAGWPGGFSRAGWAQLILLRAYNVEALHGAGTAWLAAFADAYPVWAVLYVAGLVYIGWEAIRHKTWRVWWPLLLLVTVGMFTVIRIPATILTHGLTVFTLLSIVLGAWLASLWSGPPAARGIALGVLVAMIASGARETIRAARLDDGTRILRDVEAQVPPDATVLADGAHIFRLYLPSRAWVDLEWFDTTELRHPERYTLQTSQRLQRYDALRTAIFGGDYPYLILQPRRRIADPALAEFIQAQYRLISESEGGSLYRLETGHP